MSTCPDWRRAGRGGDRFLVEGSSARRRALRHIEDCPSCRRAALRLDPSLAVGRFPLADVPREEIDAVKRQVLAMRRVRDLEAPRRRPALAHAAAVVLLLGLGLLLPSPADLPTNGDVLAPPESAAAPLVSPTGINATRGLRGDAVVTVVESLSPSSARIYQLDQQDFPVVMIVDESIDL